MVYVPDDEKLGFNPYGSGPMDAKLREPGDCPDCAGLEKAGGFLVTRHREGHVTYKPCITCGGASGHLNI